MATVTIKRKVTTEKEEDVEVTFPCFKKEKDSSIPYYVAIYGETNYIRLFEAESYTHSKIARNEPVDNDCFDSDKYEDITAEEFNEHFFKHMDELSQAATKFQSEFMVNIKKLPVPEINS